MEISEPVMDHPLRECDEFWIKVNAFSEGQMVNSFYLKLTMENLMALIVLINGIERT